MSLIPAKVVEEYKVDLNYESHLIINTHMNSKQYIDCLLESWNKTLAFGEYAVEIFKNPDSEELKDCLSDDYHSCRGLIMTDTEDLYIWPDYISKDYNLGVAEHGVVISKMKWSGKPFITIMLDQDKKITFSSWNYRKSSLNIKETDTQAIKEAINNNPHIKSLGYSFGRSDATY